MNRVTGHLPQPRERPTEFSRALQGTDGNSKGLFASRERRLNLGALNRR
jgi:hypothetical protein